MKLASRAPLVLLAACVCAVPALGQAATKRLAAGLDSPLWAGAPEGDPRIFIAQKNGRVRILKNGALLAQSFLDISAKVSTGGEQGLLGMAFHPAFAANRFFYVDYTDVNGNTVVSRFTASASNPDLALANSETVILTQSQPFANHNAGDIHFGPDGYLYIAFGDGGSGNDPSCFAQNLGTWLGKILRIDVDGGAPYVVPPDNPFVGVPGARAEIWHLGLRNPWRFSLDRLTGDMYVGDVGQNAREEISFAGALDGGVNFGWKVHEGTRCNSTAACAPAVPGCGHQSYTPPIHELLQSAPSAPRAIVGGYVYRGCAVPSEFGTYFFTDFSDDLIRSFDHNPATGQVTNLRDRTAEFAPDVGAITNVASFGEDGFGELLIVELSSGGNGEVFKMVPAGASQASAALRNGSGANSTCYASRSLPILGNLWRGEVDVSAHPGARLTFLLGHAAPASGTFLRPGELLVDSSSAEIFAVVQSSTGTIDVFDGPIPCDSALAGLTAYTQAMILGGGAEFCNALDLTVGYY
jgi:glucose/arabinose dehydrogenase